MRMGRSRWWLGNMETVIYVLLPLIALLQLTYAGNIKSYCQWEAFNATCPDGQVIMMKTAEYGRMRVGRCLNTDYYTGCQANVIQHMDEMCSGRQKCLIQIPDPTLFKVQPCRKDLIAYLEADYECVKVVDPLQDKSKKTYCRGAIDVSNEKGGYILSSVTADTNLGSRNCPWLIKVKPGQRINVTMYDFSLRSSPGTTMIAKVKGAPSKSCSVHAKLKEGEFPVGPSQATTNIALCGTEPRRRWLYMTRGTSLIVQMVNMSQVNSQSINFMLKYEVVGCADLKNPTHALMERKGDSLMISCNSSLETWHLVCKDTKWIGDYHNCSSALNKMAMGDAGQEEQGFPLGFAMDEDLLDQEQWKDICLAFSTHSNKMPEHKVFLQFCVRYQYIPEPTTPHPLARYTAFLLNLFAT